MYSCVFKDSGDIHYKLYVYRSRDKYDQGLHHQKRFQKVSKIVNSGEIGLEDMDFFSSHADDWMAIQSAIKVGYYFIFTQENRPSNQDPKDKTINNMSQDKQNPLIHSKTGKLIIPWKKEEFDALWTGTAEEVAAKIGRTVGAVNWQRKEWVRKNQNFEIPSIANYVPRSRKSKKAAGGKRWSDEDIKQLWLASGQKVAKKLNRSKQAVYLKRIEYLDEHKSFIPPKEAKFPLPARFQDRLKKTRTPVKPATVPVKPSAEKVPVQPVKNSTTFKMKVGDKEIELQEKPARLKLGDMEIEF